MSAVRARTVPSAVPSRLRPGPTKHRRAATTVAATLNGGDASNDESAKAAATERELREARVRAERMAVRLKLRSVVTGPGSVGVGPNPIAKKKSLDAAIRRQTNDAKHRTDPPSRVSEDSPSATSSSSSAEAETRASLPHATTSGASFIEEERSAVRSRLEKYSMNRYAFVVRGERKGRVVDRVTGADVSDDSADDPAEALSAQDKLDLARERVKQAEQEASSARDAAAAAAASAARRVEGARQVLEARRATLSSLAAEAAEAAKAAEANGTTSAEARAEARRALRASLDAMDARASAGADASVAGAGAKKASVVAETQRRSRPGASEDAKDAKARASDAIRARASSSLSRLRKQRRIKRAGSARRKE